MNEESRRAVEWLERDYDNPATFQNTRPPGDDGLYQIKDDHECAGPEQCAAGWGQITWGDIVLDFYDESN